MVRAVALVTSGIAATFIATLLGVVLGFGADHLVRWGIERKRAAEQREALGNTIGILIGNVTYNLGILERYADIRNHHTRQLAADDLHTALWEASRHHLAGLHHQTVADFALFYHHVSAVRVQSKEIASMPPANAMHGVDAFLLSHIKRAREMGAELLSKHGTPEMRARWPIIR